MITPRKIINFTRKTTVTIQSVIEAIAVIVKTAKGFVDCYGEVAVNVAEITKIVSIAIGENAEKISVEVNKIKEVARKYEVLGEGLNKEVAMIQYDLTTVLEKATDEDLDLCVKLLAEINTRRELAVEQSR